MMKKIVDGVHDFQKDVFPSKQDMFEHLGSGQHPLALFITCSDSRVVPNLLAQAEPGELFILRNAGNLVPQYPGGSSGEAATIEYAVSVLKVPDIVICGHSQCGAVTASLRPESTASLPAVRAWLTHAKETVRIMKEKYGDIENDADRIAKAVEVNVLVQLKNLESHPAVQSALENGSLRTHGWVYHFETGQVEACDRQSEIFAPLDDQGFSAG